MSPHSNKGGKDYMVPATGVSMLGAIIPAAAALVVLVALFILGKTKKK